MARFWGWFHGWWNAEDRTQDVKLAAFFLVVLAAIAWLSVDLRRGITDPWVETFMWLCGLVGLGGSVWTAVETWGRNRANKTKGPGAPGEGGGA